jgi:hypothetical protein
MIDPSTINFDTFNVSTKPSTPSNKKSLLLPILLVTFCIISYVYGYNHLNKQYIIRDGK